MANVIPFRTLLDVARIAIVVILLIQTNGAAEEGQVTIALAGRIHADLWTFPGDSPGVNTGAVLV